jgi:gliding motility-associated-like protein
MNIHFYRWLLCSFLFTSGVVASFAQCTLTNTGSATSPSCSNNDGRVAVTAVGAQGNLSYNWSNGGTASLITGLASGTYIVTITDSISTGGAAINVFSDAINVGSTWSLNVSTGVNGADNNFWTISDNEGGVALNACGVAGGGDATLHITSVFNSNGGASYDAGGLCGILFCPETNRRAESAIFSTVGRTNLTLDFDYISGGDALIDNASVYYNIGAGWQLLDNSIKSTTCGGGQGRWIRANYSLPAACDNQPTVQIGFNWTNNDDGVGTDPSVAINNISVTATSLATITVCTSIDTFTLLSPAGFTITATNTNIGCVNTTGTATATTNAGTAPFSFAWSNGRTTSIVTGLAAGAYFVTVTDANNCVQAASVTVVNASSSVSVAINAVTNVSCFAANDGSIQVTVIGGTAPYTYGWSRGQTIEDLTGLSEGFYALNLIDANGCVFSTNPIEITSPDSFYINIDTNSLILCDVPNSGNLTAMAFGGSLPYGYTWSNGSTTANINNLTQGSYTVSVSQGNGCTQVLNQTVLLNAPTVPALAAYVSTTGTTSVTISLGASVNLNVGNDQSAQGITYLWSANPTLSFPTATGIANQISPTATTTVTVAATSPNNCVQTQQLVIVVTSAIAFPTAFTPNGDVNNERFRPLNFPSTNINKFTIFNRWGQVVYDDKALTNGGWDGTLNGSEQPRDTYVYVIEIQEPQKTETTILRGEFTLIR